MGMHSMLHFDAQMLAPTAAFYVLRPPSACTQALQPTLLIAMPMPIPMPMPHLFPFHPPFPLGVPLLPPLPPPALVMEARVIPIQMLPLEIYPLAWGLQWASMGSQPHSGTRGAAARRKVLKFSRVQSSWGTLKTLTGKKVQRGLRGCSPLVIAGVTARNKVQRDIRRWFPWTTARSRAKKKFQRDPRGLSFWGAAEATTRKEVHRGPRWPSWEVAGAMVWEKIQRNSSIRGRRPSNQKWKEL